MRMDKDRFGEYSGHEGKEFHAKAPDSLAALDGTTTLLMYEIGSQAVNRDMIRYGKVRNVIVTRKDITFRFEQEGIFSRSVMQEYQKRLDIHDWEWNRTHWSVKDGGLPSTMRKQLRPSSETVPQKINFFISHASEDKDEFARPLAEALITIGYGVWYDEYTLTMGDSLLRKIDEGLKQADYGIVVLSKSFFAKKWPRLELEGLLALEGQNDKLILPVWLGVDQKEVAEFSPILAGRLAEIGDNGVASVVEAIRRAVSISGRTREVTAGMGAGRAALQGLTRKLTSQNIEKARLDSYAGADEVTASAQKIADEIVQEIQREDPGPKKQFQIKRLTEDAVVVSGPRSVQLATSLREIGVNSARKAAFWIRIGQGNLVAPHPGNVKTIEEIIFVPRIVDDQGVKWEEKEGEGNIMSISETVGRILVRYVSQIDETLED